VTLVKESCDLVTLLELGDLGTDFDDFTGTIGGRNYGECAREGIFALKEAVNSKPFACLNFSNTYQSYLWDNQVTVVQRGSLELHEDLVLTDSWDRCVLENKAVEIIVLVLDNPLLHS